MSEPIPDAGEQSILPREVRVGARMLPSWPEDLAIAPLSAPMMAMASFADHGEFHPELVAAILRLEHDPEYRMWIFTGGCGMKVRRLDRWGLAASNLIHARALSLAYRVLSRHAVFTDDCWASVYRRGDYCMPHAHLRSNVSIVYMLAPGDIDTDDPMAGRLVFADPRIPFCCPVEPARVTNLLLPEMSEGTMLVFASDYLHSVNPYRGTSPRITLSWNITVERLPGQAGEGWR